MDLVDTGTVGTSNRILHKPTAACMILGEKELPGVGCDAMSAVADSERRASRNSNNLRAGFGNEGLGL